MLNPLRNQRGQAMAGIGMGMLAFLAMAVVAVDIGRLAFTATEVQTAADAAATAGATAMLKALAAVPGDLGNAQAQAYNDGWNVAHSNSVNGQHADDSDPGDLQILTGNYAPTVGFTEGGTPLNAVKAIIPAVVPNIVAPIFGEAFASATVTKQATAVLSSATTTTPQLPLMITTCAPFNPPVDCGNPPSAVIQLGNGVGIGRDDPDSNSWSSFTDPFTNDVDVYQYLPTQCSDAISGRSGGGLAMPVLTTDPGTSPSLNFVQAARPISFRILADCITNQGLDTFTIPMMSCSAGPASWEAPAGSATFQLSNPAFISPSLMTLNIQLVCKSGVTSTSGTSVGSSTGDDFGTGFVTMAE